MTRSDFFVGAAVFGLIAVFGFVTGAALGKPSFERTVQPSGYWAVQGFWCALSICLLAAGMSR